jgi:hypothetical protein
LKKADAEKWLVGYEVPLWVAVALSIGRDPQALPRPTPLAFNNRFAAAFRYLREGGWGLLTAEPERWLQREVFHLGKSTYEPKVQLDRFGRWAAHEAWHLPDWFPVFEPSKPPETPEQRNARWLALSEQYKAEGVRASLLRIAKDEGFHPDTVRKAVRGARHARDGVPSSIRPETHAGRGIYKGGKLVK